MLLMVEGTCKAALSVVSVNGSVRQHNGLTHHIHCTVVLDRSLQNAAFASHAPIVANHCECLVDGLSDASNAVLDRNRMPMWKE